VEVALDIIPKLCAAKWLHLGHIRIRAGWFADVRARSASPRFASQKARCDNVFERS